MSQERHMTAQQPFGSPNRSRWSCRVAKRLSWFTARLDLWTRIWEISSGYAIKNCRNRESIDTSPRLRYDNSARFLYFGHVVALPRDVARLACDPQSPSSSPLPLSVVMVHYSVGLRILAKSFAETSLGQRYPADGADSRYNRELIPWLKRTVRLHVWTMV